MNPPSHFTRSTGPVPMQPVEEATEHQAFRRPGRLAPKWLEDLLTGQLNDEPEITSSMTSGCGQAGRRHELLSIGHQSITSESNPGFDCFKDKLSCICQHCRFHFVIEIETPGNVPCGPPSNYQDLFHHLVWVPSTESSPQHTKYYPIIGHAEYKCSAPNCGTVVKVEVAKPRLTDEHVAFLLDLDPVKQRKAQAVAEDPAKYTNVPLELPCALLWRYFKDVVAGTVDEDKKITKQNKLFRIQFGDTEVARDLLIYLDFEEDADCQAWKLPRPEMKKPTPLGTQLAFLQNVKSELETLKNGFDSSLKPLTALPGLKRVLHVEQEASTRVTGQSYHEKDYQTLGINPNTHESVFWFAFSCQRQTDPDNTDTYLEAVRRLAVGRNDEDLEMRVTTFESMRSIMPQQNEEDEELRRVIELSSAEKQAPLSPEEKVTAGYQYFSFEFPPPLDDLRMAFDKLCASNSKNRIGHIKKLAMIGHFSNDASITALAKKSVNLDDAWEFIQEEPGTNVEIIQAKASNMEIMNNAGETDGGDIPILLAALQLITKSDPKYEPLRQTSAIINAQSGTNYDTQVTVSPILEGAVDVSLPVGLQNIRNTCYLNSILQYFYTVNAVRDIVLNYDHYRLDHTVENIADRRIVSRSLGAGDPYAGQEFVRELGFFFQELKDATTRTIKPKQRLALAAFKSAELLEADGAEMLKPPALPPRPSAEVAAGPSQPSDGLNVTVTAVPVDDNLDNASMVSSQTLANGNSEQGFVSINRDGAAQDVDMGDSEQPSERRRSTDSGLDLKDFEDVVPNNTPPIPPIEEAVAPEPTLEEKIARALDDDRVTGTAQEDVSEVIGTVINHIHAAIKPTGVDPVTKGQDDVLTDTFYYTHKTYTTKRFLTGQSEVQEPLLQKDRTMVAYPDEHKTISLINALDLTFSREHIPGPDYQLVMYHAILKLPRILHIHIQRTKMDGVKINTPVDIPAVLYLDRYMDADVESELFKKRKRSWNIAAKLKPAASKNAAPQSAASQIDEPTLAEYRRGSIEEHLRDDSDDDITILSPLLSTLIDENGIERPELVDVNMPDRESVVSTSPTLELGSLPEFEKQEAGKVETLREALVAEHDQLFEGLQEHKYLLHAVICHQGDTGKSGHYWIYIFDFERQIWRQYNDTLVQEMATEEVLNRLKSNGEPYYLSYVRADSTDMVSVPPRRAPVDDAAPFVPVGPSSQETDMPHLIDIDGKPM